MINGTVDEETFANGGIPTDARSQKFGDSKLFNKSVPESIMISGENASSNTYGQYPAITLISPPAHPLNGSLHTRFHYTEFRHGIPDPQNTISGIVPLGRGPDAVTHSRK